MTQLAASTYPALVGSSTFSGVVSDSISLDLNTTTLLSTTGVFTFSNTRPILTGVVAQQVNYVSTSSAPSAPTTRQILIR